MRRRRQKNSLLPKMIGIAVLVNAILLPILAQLGVFKAMRGNHLDAVRLVTLPPPEKKPAEPKKTPPRRRTAKARPQAHASRIAARPSRPNPNQPKVVASSGGPSEGNGLAIDNSGTAAPGQLSAPPSVTPPVAPPSPPITPAPTPPPPAPAPPPAPVAPLPPHVPVVVAAEPIDRPEPRLPDDLSYDDIHAPFEAVFSVAASGSVTVKMVGTTGDAQLDALALDAARRWTFRPATEDGKPVDSFRRLQIDFYAE